MASKWAPCWPIKRSNRVMNYDGWYRSLEDAIPLATICGRVAFMQAKASRHSIYENPHPNDLHKVHPWPLVINYFGVVDLATHQCMTGLRGPDGMLSKKSTGMTASHDLLVAHLRPLWWNGRHIQGRCWGRLSQYLGCSGLDARLLQSNCARLDRFTSVLSAQLC